MEFQIVHILETGMGVFFFVMLLMFSVYAIFLAYHWFTFGTSKHISLIALALYLCGGAILLITYSLALNNL